MRRNICGPEGLYDPGKIELLNVDGSSAGPALVLGAMAAVGANVALLESGFLVLAATRDGLRWILLSRILFCCTTVTRVYQRPKMETEWRTNFA
jgi:hypothetical protein